MAGGAAGQDPREHPLLPRRRPCRKKLQPFFSSSSSSYSAAASVAGHGPTPGGPTPVLRRRRRLRLLLGEAAAAGRGPAARQLPPRLPPRLHGQMDRQGPGPVLPAVPVGHFAPPAPTAPCTSTIAGGWHVNVRAGRDIHANEAMETCVHAWRYARS